MDEIARKSFLYDFYGEMLNEHQRQVYEDFVFNDMSLGEIAMDEGISRQGVADMIKRCDAKLESYEKKLHLVDKFLKIKADIEEIHKLAEELQEDNKKENLERIEKISNEILEEL